MALYGLTAPFAAALMERFGIRRVVTAALLVVAAGSGLTVFMTASWQLILCWGVLVGLGTGSMALALVATVTGRWFVTRRGLVSGVLTAGGAAGGLVFLPLVAIVVRGLRAGGRRRWGSRSRRWRWRRWWCWLLRDRPADLGRRRRTAARTPTTRPASATGAGAASPCGRSSRARARTGRSGTSPLGMMICGATTMGLIQPHFIPAAHDHGMPATIAAGLLALVGMFDVAGTIASGWLTDRVDPR